MKYEPAYDGMRAVAIISVVIYHVSRDYLPGGWAGVDVFFVLSGYLITNILTDEFSKTGRISLKNFYMKRVLRLLPALLFLYAFILSITFFLPQEKYNNFVSVFISFLYMMNWNRAFDLFPQGVLGHTWSLSMEEQFYLVWPPLLLYLVSVSGKLRSFVVFLFIVLISIWRIYLSSKGVDDERIYNGFDTHSDGLLIGCFIALVQKSRMIDIASNTIIIPFLGLGFIFMKVPHHSYFSISMGLGLVAIFTAWIIIAFEKQILLKKAFSIKPLVYTGKISYGWYLWHYPIWCLVTLNISSIFEKSIYMNSFIVMVSYILAIISYHCIEKPFLRLKKNYESIKTD